MMSELHYSLLGDGPSDKALAHVIDWALWELGVRTFEGQWVDLSFVTPKPSGLSARISAALTLYPCDILIVHRDAERAAFKERLAEIDRALQSASSSQISTPVVPVRMTEAWLLHDAGAIRRAAGNPNGTMSLDLPRVGTIETISDPKAVLRAALQTASGATGRHLRAWQRRSSGRTSRVAELVRDFGYLQQLPAFSHFYVELRNAVASLPGRP